MPKYTFKEIVSKCDVKRNIKEGEKVEAACPVCGSDHHLYITKAEDGKVLAYCQHCNAKLPDVLKALGMKPGGSPVAAKAPAPADKGKAPKEENHGPLVENYPHVYRDPDGQEAYRKTRLKYQDGCKKFNFLHTRPDGTVVHKKPDGCNNLYNLDKLDAATPDTHLYIVEGEKCADAMTNAGFLATTTNTGAKNRIDKYLSDTDREYLGKFPVKIMIPDNDEPGWEYAQAWQQEQRARILPLPDIWPGCPPKGDIADYFQADGDPDKIRNYQFPAQEEAAALDLGTCREEQLEEYFNTLDKAQLTSPKLFARICAIKDPVKQQRAESLATFRAADLSIKREFCKNLQATRIKLAQERKGNENVTRYTDPPDGLSLACGDWIADDTGVKRLKSIADGVPQYADACTVPIMPVKGFLDRETGQYSVAVAFKRGNKWITITRPRQFWGESKKVNTLGNYGVPVDENSAKLLVKFISCCLNDNKDTLPELTSVGHLGWVED